VVLATMHATLYIHHVFKYHIHEQMPEKLLLALGCWGCLHAQTNYYIHSFLLVVG
jgi:hypothetical protein